MNAAAGDGNTREWAEAPGGAGGKDVACAGPVVRALEAEITALTARVRELERFRDSRLVGRYLRIRRFLRRPWDEMLRWAHGRWRRTPGACPLGRLEHYPPRPFVPERFPEAASGLALPSVAVVIPAFGDLRFLEEAIASVVDQPGVDARCFVCDGGSGPEAEAILGRWSRRLAGWVSEPDRGQAHAIRKGFERVAGEIMGWLNADDRLMPGALGFVAGYFARHPEADAVYGHRVVIDAAGREVGRWVLPRHKARVLRLVDYVPQETLFWRRRIWERAGGVDERYQFALDWDLLLRFQEVGATIHRLPWFLGCFRAHEGQKTRTLLAGRGRLEIEGLRERANGRPVPRSEVARAARRLVMAGAAHHGLLRLGIRW